MLIYNKKKIFHKVPLLSTRMTNTISKILSGNYEKVELTDFKTSQFLYKPIIRFFLKKWKKNHKKAINVPIT